LVASKGIVILRIFRSHSKCSCSESSTHWSWPFTRAHEKYHNHVVTTVTCLKHAWSVRLYDDKNLRFLTAAEENEAVLRMAASTLPAAAAGTSAASNPWLQVAYTSR
jgi:hypothetical protein